MLFAVISVGVCDAGVGRADLVTADGLIDFSLIDWKLYLETKRICVVISCGAGVGACGSGDRSTARLDPRFHRGNETYFI